MLVEWSRAWEIVKKVFSFTNHTVYSESLEKIPVELLGSVLPRHLQIIYDINYFFLEDLRKRMGTWPMFIVCLLFAYYAHL